MINKKILRNISKKIKIIKIQKADKRSFSKYRITPAEPSSDFSIKVLTIVSKIKPGHVMTYQEVAEKAGNKKASRAVGSILKKNYNLAIPCHRVIKSDGTAGHYNRGALRKIEILRNEGINI